MDKSLVRYVRFNGYLIFICTLVIGIYEMMSLVKFTLYYEDNEQLLEGFTFIRRHLAIRWFAAVVWLLALAAYFMAMQWKDAGFLKPAKVLFHLEFVTVVVEDVIRTSRDDGDERIIQDEKYLFVLTVCIIYILYTFNMLESVYQSQRLEAKSRESKINLINGDSSGHILSYHLHVGEN